LQPSPKALHPGKPQASPSPRHASTFLATVRAPPPLRGPDPEHAGAAREGTSPAQNPRLFPSKGQKALGPVGSKLPSRAQAPGLTGPGARLPRRHEASPRSGREACALTGREAPTPKQRTGSRSCPASGPLGEPSPVRCLEGASRERAFQGRFARRETLNWSFQGLARIIGPGGRACCKKSLAVDVRSTAGLGRSPNPSSSPRSPRVGRGPCVPPGRSAT